MDFRNHVNHILHVTSHESAMHTKILLLSFSWDKKPSLKIKLIQYTKPDWCFGYDSQDSDIWKILLTCDQSRNVYLCFINVFCIFEYLKSYVTLVNSKYY